MIHTKPIIDGHALFRSESHVSDLLVIIDICFSKEAPKSPTAVRKWIQWLEFCFSDGDPCGYDRLIEESNLLS